MEEEIDAIEKELKGSARGLTKTQLREKTGISRGIIDSRIKHLKGLSLVRGEAATDGCGPVTFSWVGK